ncbi:hypothetical protein GOODEAATRI_013751 [Goodea atripinnis]|uniref:Uncharacterized protein n=1 Tax=Goodea atripinnis TaxID=208336 RepID=A0ABV0PE19_9TELE
MLSGICDVIDCGAKHSAWRAYDIYMCHSLWGAPNRRQWCPSWWYVGWNIGPGGYTVQQSGKLKQIQKQNIGLLREKLTILPVGGTFSRENPLLLNVTNLQENVYYCGKFSLNSCQKREDKGFYLIFRG